MRNAFIKKISDIYVYILILEYILLVIKKIISTMQDTQLPVSKYLVLEWD